MNTLIIFSAEYLIGLVALLFLLYFFIAWRHRKRKLLLLSCISLPLSYVAGLLGGSLYYNPRPFVVDGITPLITHAANNGFPSDHTLLGAALSTIVLVFNRPLGILMWALTLLVGAARVWAGVHHWVDIAGGALISLVVVFLTYVALRNTRWYRM